MMVALQKNMAVGYKVDGVKPLVLVGYNHIFKLSFQSITLKIAPVVSIKLYICSFSGRLSLISPGLYKCFLLLVGIIRILLGVFDLSNTAKINLATIHLGARSVRNILVLYIYRYKHYLIITRCFFCTVWTKSAVRVWE